VRGCLPISRMGRIDGPSGHPAISNEYSTSKLKMH
jgi:hypothetical protein